MSASLNSGSSPTPSPSQSQADSTATQQMPTLSDLPRSTSQSSPEHEDHHPGQSTPPPPYTASSIPGHDRPLSFVRRGYNVSNQPSTLPPNARPKVPTPQQVYKQGVLDGVRSTMASNPPPNKISINISDQQTAASGLSAAAEFISQIERRGKELLENDQRRYQSTGSKTWNIELNITGVSASPEIENDVCANDGAEVGGIEAVGTSGRGKRRTSAANRKDNVKKARK